MPRVIWKGAISFGLVNVPVALYPASQEIGIDFDWLDKRSMDPVGYKRVNKRTGKEIDRDDIVKGIKQADGEYVVLSEDEIKAAYPVSTQTVEIETFVAANEIPFTYLEKPYYLAPLGKAEKVYALLRDAMAAAGVIGIARVVMHTKERLAALIPDGDALLLNTIRWAEEIRPRDEIAFPPAGKSAAKPKEGEMKMAAAADQGHDRQLEAERLRRQVHQRHPCPGGAARQGRQDREGDFARRARPPPATSNVVDLTELLKKSLASRKSGGSGAADKAPARKAAAKKSAPAKAARTKHAA